MGNFRAEGFILLNRVAGGTCNEEISKGLKEVRRSEKHWYLGEEHSKQKEE